MVAIQPNDGNAPAYCRRCLSPARLRDVRCGSCNTPFRGAGRFDRIEAVAPSTEFGQLFRHDRSWLGGTLKRPAA